MLWWNKPMNGNKKEEGKKKKKEYQLTGQLKS